MDPQDDDDTHANISNTYQQPPPPSLSRSSSHKLHLRLSETLAQSGSASGSGFTSPGTATQTPLHPPLNSAGSISSFLGYMQRRVTDYFMIPSASDARSIRHRDDSDGEMDDGTLGDLGPSHDQGSGLEEGTLGAVQVEPISHQLSDSPSLHRAG